MACTGDGEETADVPPEGPPIGTPPPAPPPGSSDNQPPRADAGEDRTTVEEQDVTVDGSGSNDPESNPLTYAWQLHSAPQGSAVTVGADTPTFVFRPDLPGAYELRLTVSDGRSQSTDTVRVQAEPLLAVAGEAQLKIDLDKRGGGKKDDERADLELETSRHYSGQPVGFTVAADVPWVRVANASGTTAPPGDEVSVALEIVREEAEKLSGGKHEGRVRITPSGGWEEAVTTVTLEVKRKGAGSLVPNVAYTGEPAYLELYGTGLLEATGATVFVDDAPVAHLKAINDERAAIELPALPAGEHAVRIGDGPALPDESLRLVVRDAPVHTATDLELPGFARSLDYSAELDAFYAVVVREDGARVAQRLSNSGNGEWLSETLPVQAPWALALTADGTQLIVSSEGCALHRLDPRSLAVLESSAKPGCIPQSERFGVLAALADGRVIAVDDLGDSTSWSYPQLAPMQAVPRLEDPPVLNGDRERLMWSAGVLYAAPRDAQTERTFVAPSGTATFDFTRDAFSVRPLD